MKNYTFLPYKYSFFIRILCRGNMVNIYCLLLPWTNFHEEYEKLDLFATEVLFFVGTVACKRVQKIFHLTHIFHVHLRCRKDKV